MKKWQEELGLEEIYYVDLEKKRIIYKNNTEYEGDIKMPD